MHINTNNILVFHVISTDEAIHSVFVVLAFTSHQQRGHSQTAPPFTVPCEGHEAWFLLHFNRESNPGCRVAIHYTTAAPHQLHLLYTDLLTFSIVFNP